MGSTSYQVFVTFSGEVKDDAIDTVLAIDVGSDMSGTLVATPVTDAIEEPRGMALDANLRLYVAQADKHHTAILAFPPVTGTQPLSSTVLVVAGAGSATSPLASAALLHPYGLAFGPGGGLFQSSQDTNVVSGYAVSTQGGALTATALPTAAALAGLPNAAFYPGTYVTTFVPLAVNTGITLLPQTSGGLDYVVSASGKAHSVRGIAFVGATLYVVDEAAGLVGMYDAASGGFKGWITTLGTKLPPMLSPVGITSDADGNVYIGASKSTAIYRWTPGLGSPGTLSLLVQDTALAQISGLAVLPDGSLVFGCRAPVAPAGHGGKKAPTYSIYRYDGSSVAPWVTGFTDTPECLLLVPPVT